MSPNSSHGRRVNRHAFVVGMSLVVGLAGCGGGTDKESATPPPATTSSTTTPLPTSDAPVPIEPGTYRIPSDEWAVTDYSVTIPEGWTLQYGHIFHADTPAELGFYGVVVDEIYDDACHGDGVPVKVGPGTEALVAALQKQPGPKASPPVQTTLGDHPATRIDLRVPKSMTPNCRMMGENLQVWYSEPADKYVVVLPDNLTSVYILDVDGQRQVFVTQRPSATSDEDLAELQTVLDSIRIGT